MRKERKLFSETGITILELMIVAGIIFAVLAFLAKFYADKQYQINVKFTKAKMEEIKVFLDQYRSDYGMYPTTTQGLKALMEEPVDEPRPKNWRAAISDADNLKDMWGTDFDYELADDGNSYSIISFAKDKRRGGDGTGKDIVVYSNE